MREYIKGIFWVSLVFLLVACNHFDDKETSENSHPTSNHTIEDDDKERYYDWEQFYNPYGYASLDITDRSTIEEGHIVVNDEIEFLLALQRDDVKIIEIERDLNLGFNEVQKQMDDKGLNINDFRSVFRRHSRQPIMHPLLKESGIGQVRIALKNDLMIYSTKGVTIKHAIFLIDGSTNIVIRNLAFDELWEWDEEGRGTYKRNDWDYFVIEQSSGIWLDHLTFHQAYDGIIDVKEHSKNITLSWSKLNFRPNAFIQKQIDFLEENRDLYPYYNELRLLGVTVEDIVLMSSFQKKGFNLGNSTDGEGFESITMTFHHLEVINLQDRMPRIRKGDAHLYHIYVNNEDVDVLTERYRDIGLGFVNQGIITTELGSVLMENSIFEYVRSPIKNHQDSRNDSKYTGKYRVVNSEYRTKHSYYFGSSDDKPTQWVHVNSHPAIEFEMRNYDSIPYQYALQDVYFLKETFNEYPTGHQSIEGLNWLFIDTSLHRKGE